MQLKLLRGRKLIKVESHYSKMNKKKYFINKAEKGIETAENLEESDIELKYFAACRAYACFKEIKDERGIERAEGLLEILEAQLPNYPVSRESLINDLGNYVKGSYKAIVDTKKKLR
jgi:hypothetical protein